MGGSPRAAADAPWISPCSPCGQTVRKTPAFQQDSGAAPGLPVAVSRRTRNPGTVTRKRPRLSALPAASLGRERRGGPRAPPAARSRPVAPDLRGRDGAARTAGCLPPPTPSGRNAGTRGGARPPAPGFERDRARPDRGPRRRIQPGAAHLTVTFAPAARCGRHARFGRSTGIPAGLCPRCRVPGRLRLVETSGCVPPERDAVGSPAVPGVSRV